MKGWRVHFPSAWPTAADHLEQGPGPPSGRRRAECDLCPSRSMHLSLFSLFFTPPRSLFPPISASSSASARPPSASSAPPFITYTLFAPPLLCPSSGPRPSVSSPHLIHSCLWHSHISPSIHLLCLSRSPLAFFPPFLRWWSRLVVSVRPAPLLRGYGFNLGGRRCAHQQTGVPSQWPWARCWIHTRTVILEKWELTAEMQIFLFMVLLCCSLFVSMCLTLTYAQCESH